MDQQVLDPEVCLEETESVLRSSGPESRWLPEESVCLVIQMHQVRT